MSVLPVGRGLMPFRLNCPLISAAGPVSSRDERPRIPASLTGVEPGLERIGKPGTIFGECHIVYERSAGRAELVGGHGGTRQGVVDASLAR